jgi:AraC family transcriptional regulator
VSWCGRPSRSSGTGLVERLAGVPASHLARVFRRHHGCSVGAYLRRRRLARASGELTATDRPVAEVALRAGSYDQAHLATAFQRAFGMTPTEYRRTQRAR